MRYPERLSWGDKGFDVNLKVALKCYTEGGDRAKGFINSKNALFQNIEQEQQVAGEGCSISVDSLLTDKEPELKFSFKDLALWDFRLNEEKITHGASLEFTAFTYAKKFLK